MMSNMKNCSSCGEPVAKSAKFCPKCGAQLKKPLFKRILLPLIPVIGVIILVAVIGIFNENSKKRDTLIAYINEDVLELEVMKEEMLDSYNSVMGVNYTDDLTAYNEINDRTIPLCQELREEASKIKPTDSEISKIHSIYIKQTGKYLNAFALVIATVENQDRTQIVEANELILEADELGQDFKQALYKLADERGVVFDD